MTRAPSSEPRQRLPGVLTSLEAMRERLLRGVTPVAPLRRPLAQAQDGILADVPEDRPQAADVALRDGWACRSADLVGASAYAPVVPDLRPVRVTVGEALPAGCDCVLPLDAVEPFGSELQALGEAYPGAEVRRAGEEFPPGWMQDLVGRRLGPLPLALLAAAGVETVLVRRPRVLVCDERPGVTQALVAALLHRQGALVTLRQGPPVAPEGFDALVCVGGTGEGEGDRTLVELHKLGLDAHYGMALIPGTTVAAGWISGVPATTLPGRTEQALAGFLALLRPLLRGLTAGFEPASLEAPLARKIASPVGLAELVLLAFEGGRFLPLAAGDLPLHRFAQATHWCILPAGSEGAAAGSLIAAEPLADLF